MWVTVGRRNNQAIDTLGFQRLDLNLLVARSLGA
jgi:hypothetical protein